jgi:tetratricopeptide (TPR) repeat protein/predicted Ser/Thr protein kinase
MDDRRWQRICELFERAREVHGAERSALLAAAPDLRAEVEDLLGFHDRPAGPLERTAGDADPPARIGPYRVERVLGAGGMGTVYLGEGPEGQVALKRLHAHLAGEPRLRARFEREAGLGERVRHPNVVRTLGTEGADCIVMEYVEGQTLEEVLEEQGPLPEELCLHIATEVARGLAAIHEAGAVHRDLKPANVILTPDHRVKVMDLGIALPAEELLRLSQTGQFVGTVRYCAPEQLRGPTQPLDGRTDLYALGLLVYELAAGRSPIPGEDLLDVMRAQLETRPRPLGELRPQVSPFLEELVAVLLAKQPEERVADAGTLVGILQEGSASAWWNARRIRLRDATRRPLRRIRVPRETAVVGRDDELAALEAAFEDVRAGRGRVVLVEGEAGIGKTRLLDEALGRFFRRDEDVAVLTGAFPPGSAGYGAGAMRGAARDYLADYDLDAVLPRLLAETPRLVPAFAAFLRGEPAPEGEAELSRPALQSAYLALLRALSAERPLVLLVEDLHFAPDEGRSFFSALAMGVAEHRILLLGTSRHGLPPPWLAELERLEHARRLALSRLGPQEIEQVLQDVFGASRLVEEIGWTVARISDGNPYFVFEILQGLRDQGVLRRRQDGSWATTDTLPTIELPSSLVELMAARLSGLDEDEQELLDVAACHGSPFDGAVLAEALERPLIPLLRSLGRIEREHRLVRAFGAAFVFDHDQVREIVYQRMSPALRKAYHGVLGDTLHRRWTEPDPPQAAAMCRHLLEGGRGAAALPHVSAAAQHLQGAVGVQAAADLLEKALAAPDLQDVSLKALLTCERATMLRHMGRLEACRAAMDDAVRLGREGADEPRRVQTLRRSADLYLHAGQYETCEALLEEGLGVAREAGDGVGEAGLLGQQGMSLWMQGRLDEADAAFRHALECAREAGSREAEMYAEGGLGLTLARRGRPADALEHFQAWQDLAEATGSTVNVLGALGARGKILRLLGRREEAAALAEEWARQARERGDRDALGTAYSTLAELETESGRLVEARERLAVVLRISAEVGSREGTCSAGMQLAMVEARMGGIDVARERLRALCAQAAEEGHGLMEVYATTRLGDVALLAGDLDEARRSYAAADEGVRAAGAQEFLPAVLEGRAGVALASGDHDAARPCLRELLQTAEAQGVPGFSLLAKAGLVETGDLEAGPVREELEASAVRLSDEEVMTARWRLYRATGDEALRRAVHRQVRARLEHVPAEAQAAMSERLALVREVLAAQAP